MGYIVTIRDIQDIEIEQARHDWSEVTSKKQFPKANIYVDTRSGWRFCKIIGAVAYPYIDAGCVMVAGIQSEPMGRVVILDYQEHTDIFQAIESMADFRKAYGYQHENPDVLGEWIGDTEKYLDIISRTSQVMEKHAGADSGLYVRNPAGWEDTKPVSAWVRHLKRAMAEKRVLLNRHMALVNRLQSFGNESLEHASLETHPSVGILAALVYTIGIERQWEGDIDNARNEPINIAW